MVADRGTLCAASLNFFALLEVADPGGIVWVSVAADFDVSTNCRSPGEQENVAKHGSVRESFIREEPPTPPANGAEVLVCDPGSAFMRRAVPAERPLPEALEQGCIDSSEGLFAVDMPMIVRPAPKFGVELSDQADCCCLGIEFNKRPDVGQKGFDVLVRRSNERFAAIGAYVLTEEVEPFGAMSDAGFLRREFQPPLLEEFLHKWANSCFKDLFRA